MSPFAAVATVLSSSQKLAVAALDALEAVLARHRRAERVAAEAQVLERLRVAQRRADGLGELGDQPLGLLGENSRGLAVLQVQRARDASLGADGRAQHREQLEARDAFRQRERRGVERVLQPQRLPVGEHRADHAAADLGGRIGDPPALHVPRRGHFLRAVGVREQNEPALRAAQADHRVERQLQHAAARWSPRSPAPPRAAAPRLPPRAAGPRGPAHRVASAVRATARSARRRPPPARRGSPRGASRCRPRRASFSASCGSQS